MKTQDIKNMAAAMLQVAENQSMANKKALAKASASSEKGKAAVTLPKAPFDIPKEGMSSKEKMKKGLYNSKMDPVGQADADIDNDGDVDKSDKYLKNRRKAITKSVKKGAKSEVDMNPKKKSDNTDQAAMESTVPSIYARILENRAAHAKGATAPEDMDNNLKGAGAKKMKSDMTDGAKFDDTEEKGHKDVADAGRVTKGPSPRKGDNKAGDKAVINKPEDVTQKGMKG